MFIKNFDEVIETDDFVQIVAFLAATPIWKLALFYLYTFFLGRERGRKYRKYLRYIKFPLYLRWKLFWNWVQGKK
jgi:hypothetical protein